jgi:hypothetical protein
MPTNVNSAIGSQLLRGLGMIAENEIVLLCVRAECVAAIERLRDML